VSAQRMDVLRNLFGNLSAGIIRLLVTVGILAAAYFFVVKPTLETTSDISREVNDNIQKGFQQSDLGDINKTIDDVNRQVQREIKQSLRASKQQGDADKLIRCIQRAHQNVNKIQRCSEKY
jgi:F0F1-type ATP synthase membrane subunit b/b'